MEKLNKPELLAPAGNLEKLKTAVTYGADAVYIGGEEFSLRVAADNFTPEEIAEGVKFAHERGRRVYLTANVIPHNKDVNEYADFLRSVKDTGIDAVILSDLGIFSITKEVAPDLDIHVSTQANNVNWKSAETWYKMGAKRVILAREMSLEEIREIREKTPKELELEAFVHGAMCISYSGRCLLTTTWRAETATTANAPTLAAGSTSLWRSSGRESICRFMKTSGAPLFITQRICVCWSMWTSWYKAA